MRTIIHNIEIVKTGLGMSGGENSLLSLVTIWNKTKQVKNIIYTSENGIVVYKPFLKNKKNIEFHKIGDYAIEANFGILISYAYRSILSVLNVERFNEECNNVIFTHSDYFPNVFFSFLLKRRNPGAKWIIFYHMLAANPFKNIKNQFTSGGYCIPKINMLLNWINEKVCFFLIKSADLIVIHNGLYEKALRKHNRRILILENYGGIEKNEYLRTKKPTGLNRKRYDACFIGRFHEQKGVLEMIEIIKNIKKW